MQNGSQGNFDFSPNLAQRELGYSISPLAMESMDWPYYPQQADNNLAYVEDGQAGTPTRRMFQGYSTLGLEEELALRKIAMPSSTISTFSMDKSSNDNESTTNTTSTRKSSYDMQSVSSTMPPKSTTGPGGRPSKRRRTDTALSFGSSSCGIEEDPVNGETGEEEEDEDEDDPVEAFKALKKKQGHNAIEKRYRSSLNEKILTLDKCIPLPPSIEKSSGGPRGESDQRHKTTKSAILTRAVQHIKTLEKNTRRLVCEGDALNVRVAAFEKLALSGSLRPMP
jgi:hypothetical protein